VVDHPRPGRWRRRDDVSDPCQAWAEQAAALHPERWRRLPQRERNRFGSVQTAPDGVGRGQWREQQGGEENGNRFQHGKRRALLGDTRYARDAENLPQPVQSHLVHLLPQGLHIGIGKARPHSHPVPAPHSRPTRPGPFKSNFLAVGPWDHQKQHSARCLTATWP
jgi:hypothetical protein